MIQMHDRLRVLASRGIDIEQALDIGAYRGEFSDIMEDIWPGVRIQQFEADDRNIDYLNKDAKIVVLGDEERIVELHMIEDTGYGSTTGTSIFKEQTEFYSKSFSKMCKMVTLDSVVDMSGDWRKGLIKIDTQGSELKILNGARELLKRRPRFIILECSYVEYNKGAPLIHESFQYMSDLGFKPIDILGMNYLQDGTLIQSDILFES